MYHQILHKRKTPYSDPEIFLHFYFTITNTYFQYQVILPELSNLKISKFQPFSSEWIFWRVDSNCVSKVMTLKWELHVKQVRKLQDLLYTLHQKLCFLSPSLRASYVCQWRLLAYQLAYELSKTFSPRKLYEHSYKHVVAYCK